jgi:hypothetical protein
MKGKNPFLMQRNWVGARPANEGSRPSPSRSRRDSAPAPRMERSRPIRRSVSSYCSSSGCETRSSRRSQPEGRDPNSIKPEEVICHGMQVTNVDNYIANLFR